MASIPKQMREHVQSVDPSLPVFGAHMLTDIVLASLNERRFAMEKVGLLALTALLLAGIGIYGVISYMVSARTHEFGIRMALRAQSAGIIRMVIRDGLRLAVFGSAVGIAGSLVFSRAMASVLYGVRGADPLTFGVVVVLLAGVAGGAASLPARRATAVDPMLALRSE